MIESAADRASFFADDGVVASYGLAGGGTLLVVGHIERPVVETGSGDAGTLDAQPTFHCRSVDLPVDAAEGDTLTVPADAHHEATTYAVASILPDGTGLTILVLGT